MTEDEIRERLMIEIDNRVDEKRNEQIKTLKKWNREIRYETKQWLMLGWGYKPRLNDPKNAVAHKRPLQWHRIRANPKLR